MELDKISKTSMLYWWDKVKGLEIPIPKTEIIEIPFEHLIKLLDGDPLPDKYIPEVFYKANKVGYPLFLRTDMGSAKHSWEHTCYVQEEKELFRHIWSLIDNTLAMGMFGELDPNALVFREFLRLDHSFTAFSGLPISCERRYFVRDGLVQCHHPYWIHDALVGSWKQPSIRNWEEELVIINDEQPKEITLLTEYTSKVGAVLDGYWSVDFAKSIDNIWYLIDMAEGDKSWHSGH